MMTLAGTAADQSATVEPSADLLLYLAEFEDAAGDFVDPMTLEEATAPAPQLESDADNSDDDDHER
ncbi:MAG: hypothetical protein R3F18_07885 [Lysobacterales bacterium]|nr:hypothetical protein [Xanthomonadales bacterium]MCB1611482.1 hypothetical protein [Xanthomonadales bacterium]MCP5473662.1 hypothetical protein [Rhodanobacteraceae bacterium]